MMEASAVWTFGLFYCKYAYALLPNEPEGEASAQHIEEDLHNHPEVYPKKLHKSQASAVSRVVIKSA